MAALNFQAQFAPLVESGEKRQKTGVTATRVQTLDWEERKKEPERPDDEPVPEDDIPF